MKCPYLLLAVFSIILYACQPKNEVKEYSLVGKTMGTSYLIKYVSDQKHEHIQIIIDSILNELNASLSTYIDDSTISKVNQADSVAVSVDNHFINNFIAAKKVYETTNGSFNPAVMPLVNYYGFGFEKVKDAKKIDTTEVQKLHLLVDFNNFELKTDTLFKKNKKAQIDFSAIAKGYGVDQLAAYLKENKIENFLVEIGGEAYAQGKNGEGRNWRIAIRKPSIEKKMSIIKAIDLDKKAIATSGNYENYRELEDRIIIGHTIDPKTGYPQKIDEELLSSTVFAPTCMMADAYATAFKVMGLSKSIAVLNNLEDIEVYFVYKNERGELGIYTNLKE